MKQFLEKTKILKKEIPKIRKKPSVQRITYIATNFDREKGWDSYKEVSDLVDAPVYLLTPDLINRFNIERAPSVITAKNNRFLIQEYSSTTEGTQ